MRVYAMLGVGGAALMASAAAQPFNVACVKGADERKIEIVSPGEVGAACDVRYAQASGVRTPYHANNSAEFCRTKAEEIVATLITAGYACGQVGGPLTAEARTTPEPQEAPTPTSTPAPVSQEPAETAFAPALAEPLPEPAVQTAPQQAAPAAAPEPVAPAADVADSHSDSGTAAAETATEPPAAPGRVEAGPAETPTEASLNATTVDAAELEPLEEPSHATVATGGPSNLGAQSLEKLERATAPIPAGRLVGAEPAPEPVPEPTPVIEPTPATQAAPAPVVGATAVAAAPASPEAAPRAAPPKRASALRDPKDIIVATLNAQAAAWNEGNLPAFMDIYWRDEDLKFVSGTSITKGWSSTMKRYRDRYAGETGLGRLSFEKTEVEMVTDDVAVVTGRFNHVKGEDASSGVFTLVMKQMNGVWRIVHDHTASDAPSAQ